MTEKIEYDYSKLRGAIREKRLTQEQVGDGVGFSKVAINRKLANKSTFNSDEIIAIMNLLGLDQEEVKSYFFVQKVRI